MEKLTPVKARLLMSLIEIDEHCRSISYMAAQHNVAKSTISRAADWCEEQGLLRKDREKRMYLTEHGRQIATRLARGKKIADEWCRLYAVSAQNAEEDAEALYLGCSEELLEKLSAQTLLYSASRQMHKTPFPSSYQLCRALPDGEYQLDFVFYKYGEQPGFHVSMANEGFVHPLRLKVYGSDGTVVLSALSIQCRSRETGSYMAGEARSLRYVKEELSYDAVRTGNEFFIPFEIFHIISISDCSCHAVAELCIRSTVAEMHMPESRVSLLLIL